MFLKYLCYFVSKTRAGVTNRDPELKLANDLQKF